MKIDSLPVIMHFNAKYNTVKIEIVDRFFFINKAGKKWVFYPEWKSDGHSVGSYFKHFDAWTIAALCHDQDCEIANKEGSYKFRRQGDKDYRNNLIELGAPKTTVYRRYAAVSSYAYALRLKGDLK